MRLLSLVMGVLLAAAAIGTRAQAQNYPWCASYSGLGGTNCGFTTQQQCMATISGAGGFCTENTQYQPHASSPTSRQPVARAAAATSHQVKQKAHQILVAPQPQ